MINNIDRFDTCGGGNALYTMFDEVRADFRDLVVDDVVVTCSEDYKKLNIHLTNPRLDSGYNIFNYTFTNNESIWMKEYEYINVVKNFMNAYNKYSDNGTAEPKIKIRALRRAYNERVHRCGETW